MQTIPKKEYSPRARGLMGVERRKKNYNGPKKLGWKFYSSVEEKNQTVPKKKPKLHVTYAWDSISLGGFFFLKEKALFRKKQASNLHKINFFLHLQSKY